MASEQQHNAQAMFNLGYMHEQGLGMKKDIHLAKRCYDLAAETSADAKVPVTLALMKLQLLFKLESLRESPFSVLLELDENIASNWDLYLITILTIVLGAALYFRRPPPPGAAGNNYNNQPVAAAAAPVVAGAGVAGEEAPLLDRPAAPSSTTNRPQQQQQQREDAPQ